MRPQDNRRSHRKKKGSDWKEPKNPNRFRATKTWKKKYKCHKNKGEHTMELVKPDSYRGYKARMMTVEEFYANEERKYEKKKERGYWSKVLYYWQCSACGHKDLGFNKHKYDRK